jgi:hypothetical protein
MLQAILMQVNGHETRRAAPQSSVCHLPPEIPELIMAWQYRPIPLV